MLHLSTSTPHGPASQRALIWSRVGSRASDSPCTVLPALRLDCFVISAGAGGIRVVSCDDCTLLWGDVLLWAREGVCVWEGLLPIMCTLGRA